MSRPAEQRIERPSPATIMAAATAALLVSGASAHGADLLTIAIERPGHLTLSPDGHRAGIADDDTVIVVETDTGREVDRLSGDCCVTGLAWVGDDDILIARSSTGLQLYRPGIFQPPSNLAAEGCSAVSAAHTLAVAACGDGLVLVGVEDGAGSVVAYGGLGFFHDLALTPDGGMVIAAHRDIESAAGARQPETPLAGDPATALFLDVAADWPVDPPAAYGEMVLEADIRHLASAPGGAVATLDDGSVARLSTEGLSLIHESVMPRDGERLVVLPDGGHAVGGFADGPVLDLETGAMGTGPLAGDPFHDGAPGAGVWAVSAPSDGGAPMVAWAGTDQAEDEPVLRVWRGVAVD